jgi:hypothetical protein
MKLRVAFGTVLMAMLLADIGAVAVATRNVSHSGVPASAWRSQLARVELALEANQPSDAIRAWNGAWGAAVGARDWESLLAVGDAALHVGQATGAVGVGRADARRAYMAALRRAEAVGSRDGVVRCAEAFASLGDDDAADSVRRIAARVRP